MMMMTVQWALVAGLLYLEVGLILLLLMPFFSPAFWQKIFRSRVVSFFSARAGIYFNTILVGLIITFVSAVIDVNRFSKITDKEQIARNVNADNLAHMRLFRSQRNFYISGFALFLILVLKRLVTLIATQAQLNAALEASLKQAKNASATAQRLMDEQEKTKETKMEGQNEELEETIRELKRELKHKEKFQEELENEKQRLLQDYDALKSQAKQNNSAYDGLMDEHAALQRRVAELEGTTDLKKED